MKKTKNLASITTGGPGKTETLYEKPLAARKIADKTGWQLRPENEMIMKGKKK